MSLTEQAEKFMSHIEKYFLFMHKEMGRFYANQSIFKDRLVKGSKNFGLCILELQDDLGEKSSHLMDKFDAPSL